MLCGKTCGCKAVKAASSHRGRCSRYTAAGAERQRRYGCISVPLSRSVGRAKSPPVGGGPKPYSFVYRSAIFGLPLTIPASTLSP